MQSLLYAYIILYFLEKWNLLWLDWLFAFLCFAFTLLTGEFASLINFHFLGKTYITGNFLTRALPYLLIGHALVDAQPKPRIFVIIIGIPLIIFEIGILRYLGAFAYSGHLIGKAVIAVSVSIFIIVDSIEFGRNYYSKYFVYGAKFLYFVMQPAYLFTTNLFGNKTMNFTGMITIVLRIIAFSVLYAMSRLVLNFRENKR